MSFNPFSVNKWKLSSWSSLSCADSIDSFDFLSPSVPIGHVLYAASSVSTELMYIRFWLVCNTGVFMGESTENVTCFSSSDQNVLLVLLGWFVRWEVSVRIAAIFVRFYLWWLARIIEELSAYLQHDLPPSPSLSPLSLTFTLYLQWRSAHDSRVHHF